MHARHVPAALLIFGLTAVASPAGCDRKTAHSPPVSTGPTRTGTGVIRGTVTLDGQAPVMSLFPNGSCHPGAGPQHDESVVVSSTGKLQNVIVYLEDAPPAPAPAALPAVVLDQFNCQYVPHVLAVRTGQTLHVATHDPVFHNVHGACTLNEPFNFALVADGHTHDMTFNQAEIFSVRCDVHPWMKGWIGVFAHPYFATTDKDGNFELHDVPPGTFTLVAWQEKYGNVRSKVTVSDGQTSIAPITFQSGL